MKKTFKLSIILILILTMAIAVFGCTRKTPDKPTTPEKQTEQNKPDEQKKPDEEGKKPNEEGNKPSEEKEKPSEEGNKPNIKKKVKIKFTIKGQKTFGDEYEQAEGTESEYVSSIEKEEEDTIKATELLDSVKEKINGTIYNKDEMFYKHDGEAISETQPIQVKAPNTVIEFYINRQIRTITLDTTHTVNTSNLKGAVEIANENKILKFRHGYNFVGDETPTIAETENEEFNCWLKDSNTYRFDNTNSVTSNITLRPNMKNKIEIKFVIKGQKTFGDGYEQAEDTDAEYASNIKKKEGQTVKASELLNIVKAKINETIYKKDEMSYKHDGEAVGEEQPIQVKAPNTVIEFYVKRQIRTITLDTTDTVNISNVKGAVEIANDNKILKFRHGYSFEGDETPIVAGTEEDEFNGWLNGGNIYRFGNPNSVTADATLIPNMRKRDAIVNINLNGLSGTDLRYEADGITARPDGSNTNITFNVPYSKMPYTLKHLRTDSAFTVGGSRVEQTGYSGEVNINKAGNTYNLTVTYRELGATVNIGGLEGNGWYYSDAGIDAVQSGNKITLNVPSERLPYTLKPLQNTGLPFSSVTQKAVKYVGYQDNDPITTGGDTYERTAQFSEDIEKYKGLYPQTKVESSEIEGTTITEEVANNEPKAGYGKFSYTLAYNKGNKFEVINGEYYKFEPVEWEEFPLEPNKQWTKNTLDVSIFDNGQENSNIYSGSYIEGYLRIMAQKMQIDYTLSLPKLGGNDALAWNAAKIYSTLNTAAEIKEKLKYKKITDYARAVSGNYKTLRNITTRVYGNDIGTTWLGTRHQDANKYSYYIDYGGMVASEYTYCVKGLRVAK